MLEKESTFLDLTKYLVGKFSQYSKSKSTGKSANPPDSVDIYAFSMILMNNQYSDLLFEVVNLMKLESTMIKGRIFFLIQTTDNIF